VSLVNLKYHGTHDKRQYYDIPQTPLMRSF